MEEKTEKYCKKLLRYDNYSQCYADEALRLFCPDLESVKRLILIRNFKKKGSDYG